MSPLGDEWHISPIGSDIITENGTIRDSRKIFELALNYDLKEICSPILINEFPKESLSKSVLQIQKIRNISAPKASEDSQVAPRMLKLSLTDGDTFIQALELSPINSISRNHTPPGSKVLINKAKIVSGYLLLTESNCTLLGGKVPHLVEKWELAKSINRHHGRNSCEDGPPPWVSFGKRVQTDNQQKNFNSLGKNKESKENSEFELQRQGAIAEATSGASPKVFGGRVKQNIQLATGSTTVNKNFDRKDQGKVRHRNQPKEKDEEEKLLKPSDKVSLFSFLEDKLPVSESAKIGGIHNSNISYNQSKDYRKISNQRTTINDNKDNKSIIYNMNTSNIRAKNICQLNNQCAVSDVSGESEKSSTQSRAFDKSYMKTTKIENYKRHGNTNEISNKLFNHDNSSSKFVNTLETVDNYEIIKNPKNHFRQDKLLSNNKKTSDKPDYINPNTSRKYQGNTCYDKPKFNNYKKDDKQSSSNKNESKLQPHWKPSYDTNTTNTDSSFNTDKRECVSNAPAINANSTSVHDWNETEYNQNMEKVSMNSQFASRSLRQHLNLGSSRKLEEVVKETDSSSKEQNNEKQLWQVGDEILAKYWEDGKFYSATVTAVTDKTYAVKFKGYGNIEEIFKHDCLPIQNNTRPNNNYRQNRQFGSLEFRRSNRNYN